ncbi:TnsA-like heteromeric transposase endonuclease subunit [Mycobacterium sp. AZCC_0083]|uniref:TnsA-like heteromeric transposase endonuclease subunit n=1 Tax=Mycobacterium sp. AZCC_0083 TaxID=2735882 RepID=UPI0035CB3DE9
MMVIRDAYKGENAIAAEHVLPLMVQDAHPWREFRWYLGQPHFSGSYWSSTESKHAVYESRLELGRLLMADFDPSVGKIVAQPFMMRAKVNGYTRGYVRDYWLLTADGSVVVEVKPKHRIHDQQSSQNSSGLARSWNPSDGDLRSPANSPLQCWITCVSSRDTAEPNVSRSLRSRACAQPM